MDRQTFMACMIVILLMCATVAMAKPVAIATQNGESITLHDDPCPLKNWKLAVYRYANGKEVKGCWNPAGDLVITFWEDGDVMPVPPQAFKPVTAI